MSISTPFVTKKRAKIMGKLEKFGLTAGSSTILPLTAIGVGFGAENTVRNAFFGMLTGLGIGATTAAILVYLAETGYIDIVSDYLKDHLTTWGALAVEASIPTLLGAAGGGAVGCCVGNFSSAIIELTGIAGVGISSLLCGGLGFFKKKEPKYAQLDPSVVGSPSIKILKTAEQLKVELSLFREQLTTIVRDEKPGLYDRKALVENFEKYFGKETERPTYIQNNFYEVFYKVLDSVENYSAPKTFMWPDDKAKRLETWIEGNINTPFRKLEQMITDYWNPLTGQFHESEEREVATGFADEKEVTEKTGLLDEEKAPTYGLGAPYSAPAVPTARQ